MSSAANVEAHAVGTIAWLSAPETTIVVPVYQRQYRWDIGGCEKLLSDVRAVADADSGHTHFLGSILSSSSAEDGSHDLVLIDGQQRITTIMLLVAALHHTLRTSDPQLATELGAVLVRGDQTTLRPHRAWAGVFEDVILDRPGADASARASRFDDNYAFFRSQIRPGEAAHLWRGVQRLEHVSITLGEGANAQQIFESLNSTGEPLRDHELIHNYVLMGLTHPQQTEIEQSYWMPIESATGEQIGAFWRHYLVMLTGREVQVDAGRGVYDTFRQEFPRLDVDTLRARAAQWRRFAQLYAMILDPASAPDAEIARHLTYLSGFGRDMSPLVMRHLQRHADGEISTPALIAALEDLQSVLLRRTVCGLSNDRLVARLCRALEDGEAALTEAMGRITPSDERTRVGLKYVALPHPLAVLSRLAGDIPLGTADVVHIAPLSPAGDWSGDGVTPWSELGDDAQNALRALAPTLGNLTLAEHAIAERAFDATYPVAREQFARSSIALTREVASTPAWSSAAIAARTEELAERFMTVWRRPTARMIDDDDLTPILDARKRRGWPRGWQREFDYVEYRGEHWEVPDVKYLFHRIFQRLWADSRQSVIDFSARNGGPVYPEMAWNGQWDALGDGTFLYLGWDSRYMLSAVQGVLEEAGWAREVFVKYSYIGNAMR